MPQRERIVTTGAQHLWASYLTSASGQSAKPLPLTPTPKTGKSIRRVRRRPHLPPRPASDPGNIAGSQGLPASRHPPPINHHLSSGRVFDGHCLLVAYRHTAQQQFKRHVLGRRVTEPVSARHVETAQTRCTLSSHCRRPSWAVLHLHTTGLV